MTDLTERRRKQNATMIEMLEASAEGMADMLLRLPKDFGYRKRVRGSLRITRSAIALLKQDAEGWFGSTQPPSGRPEQ